ncbi:MAG: DUF1697 domain-containing protein [marine benthic group bacterium]|nr:DUF1697 domain-containing protein [Gemmatimonadota bacterium]
MQPYVAFLRGINVGGHRVTMDQLRGLFEDMGFSNVSTFIASGNVVFSASSEDVGSLAARIEQCLADQLGYDVATLIRSPAELEAIAAFGAADAGTDEPSTTSLYVVLLQTPASDDLRSRLSGLRSEMDEFRFSGREIYWLLQGKISESRLFGRVFEKAIRGVPNTTRNITTIRRLVAKLGTGQARA